MATRSTTIPWDSSSDDSTKAGPLVLDITAHGATLDVKSRSVYIRVALGRMDNMVMSTTRGPNPQWDFHSSFGYKGEDCVLFEVGTERIFGRDRPLAFAKKPVREIAHGWSGELLIYPSPTSREPMTGLLHVTFAWPGGTMSDRLLATISHQPCVPDEETSLLRTSSRKHTSRGNALTEENLRASRQTRTNPDPVRTRSLHDLKGDNRSPSAPSQCAQSPSYRSCPRESTGGNVIDVEYRKSVTVPRALCVSNGVHEEMTPSSKNHLSMPVAAHYDCRSMPVATLPKLPARAFSSRSMSAEAWDDNSRPTNSPQSTAPEANNSECISPRDRGDMKTLGGCSPSTLIKMKKLAVSANDPNFAARIRACELHRIKQNARNLE